ncbi:sugar transferase [Clostridium sporogenes]|uniref:sugar transferase n=1 Tax=Clostridium sporogenes TaxID=1509 RepID=UPI00313C6508
MQEIQHELKAIKYEFLQTFEEKPIYSGIKRFFDVVLSLIACIIAIPIITIACIFVVLETEGSPIYCQKRLGKDGKEFILYKIRSMTINAESLSGPKWADKNDKRVTKVGKFIRKTRIDELPQLFNIIKGDMSIVGPRPERPIFTEKFEKDIPGFKDRLKVVPGLTGLAQINGGYDITPKSKLKWDLKYIQQRGLWLDLKIILKTALIVLNGNGAR